MDETIAQQLTAALNNATVTQSDTGQGYPDTNYFIQQPWTWSYSNMYPICSIEHVYTNDEKLLLNAIRRDEKLKDKTLKFVLVELLKSLEK
jgi:hypothetical protein